MFGSRIRSLLSKVRVGGLLFVVVVFETGSSYVALVGPDFTM